ncbi:MAG: winged helix-turn-helix transcriptional regulator [Candidatus Ranarchaeia archaeon]
MTKKRMQAVSSCKDAEYYYNKYRDLFPEPSDQSVKNFFLDLSLLFARQDGLIKNQNVFSVRTELFGLPKRELRWNTQIIEPWLNRIRTRLQTLKKYRIRSKEKIGRLLMTSFAGEKKLSRNERKVLESLLKYPGMSYLQLASRINISDTTIRYNVQQLQRKINLIIQASVDIGKLKLRHYIVFFRVPSHISREELEQILQCEYRITLTSGFFGELADQGYWAWASFWIPNQRRTVSLFKHEIFGLKPLFHEIRLYEVQSKTTGVNLAFFDNRQWFFDENVFAQGLLEFAKDWGHTFPPIKIFSYHYEPIAFDRIDYLLCIDRAHWYRSTLSDSQQTLKNYGYKLSKSAISMRLKRLKDEELFQPFTAFRGLGLPNFLTFLIECDQPTRELLTLAVSQFPQYFLSTLDDGLLLAISLPDGALSQFRYLFETLREDVDRMEVFYRYSNLGSDLSYNLAYKWNERRQYWEFPSHLFEHER